MNVREHLGCLDANGSGGWTCIEFDGTGLWCDHCLVIAEMDRLLSALGSIADRLCLCEGHLPHKPHGGPCCGVAGGLCVTCSARLELGMRVPA